MKQFFTLSIICNFFCVISSFSQEYYVLVQQAKSLYNKGNYAKSCEFFARAFKEGTKNSDDLFDAACSAARTGDKEKAFAFLDSAVLHGYANFKRFTSNTDLDTLHKDVRWTALATTIQQRSDKIESGYDIPLQKELLAIFSDDQTVRLQYSEMAEKLGYNNHSVDSLANIMAYRDSINLSKVIMILDERGWVGTDKIGSRANQTLFLVIQHCSDLAIQEKYLPMLRDAVRRGDASVSDLALLEDRVAVRNGGSQTYGTQIYWNEKTSKNYIAPLVDPDNLDNRRALVRLEPIADYAKRFDIIWDLEDYKRQLPELKKLSKKW